MKEFYVESINGKIYCKVIGEGKPIIFVHGGPGISHSYYLPYMRDLLKYGYQLIFYDQRGNGHSKVEDENVITINSFIDDIEYIRKYLRFDKIIVFGHSFGGYLAYLYALQHPKNVYCMILCGVGPLSDEEWDEYNRNWRYNFNSINIEELKSMQGYCSELFSNDDELKIMANRFYDKTNVSDFVKKTKDSSVVEENIYMVQRRIFKDLNQILFHKKEYVNPNVKSLIIHGEKDTIPVCSSLHWASFLRCDLRIIKESNHFPFVEKTEEVSQIIHSFIEDI